MTDRNGKLPDDIDALRALILAERAAHAARLIEFDPVYCDVIVRRFEAFTGKRARLAETGATFEDVAEARVSALTSA